MALGQGTVGRGLGHRGNLCKGDYKTGPQRASLSFLPHEDATRSTYEPNTGPSSDTGNTLALFVDFPASVVVCKRKYLFISNPVYDILS